MKTLQIKKGELLHKAGDNADTLEYIESGRIELRSDNFSITFKKGVIIGLLEHAGSPYSFNYVADEDTVVHIYPYTRKSDVNKIVEDHFSNCDQLITAIAGQVVTIESKFRYFKQCSDDFCDLIKQAYTKYKDICEIYRKDIQTLPFIETFKPFVPEKDIPEWLNDYYDELEIMPRQIKQTFFGSHTSLCIASIIQASEYAGLFIRMCNQINSYTDELLSRFFDSSSGDIYDLYYNLLLKSSQQDINNGIRQDVKDNIYDFTEKIKNNPLIPTDKLAIMAKRHSYDIDNTVNNQSGSTDSAYSKIDHSLDVILDYTNFDEAECDRFRKLIKMYLNLKDKNSSDQDSWQLRQDISKSFFDIYEAAVISSIESKNIPVILKMFLYFGYIDENLIGKDNALKLYNMVETINFNGRNSVYTVYDWLTSIYKGENEPSKNEFDQDFQTYIKSQRQSGILSEDTEKRYLSSPKEKMRFELMNMFKSAVKISSGRPTVFCPVLSEHNVIIPLEKILVTADKIIANWNLIRAIDYSCFYRECIYKNDDYKIARDVIQVQILPNVILMPCIGTRAGLWQETSGIRRDTPARMFAPIFSNEDLLQLQIKLAGEFRWEMCKKIQGARWNDISDHSLTSDYFDYLQFYKKNIDLTADAKDKVKSSLTANKNSFKNVFISDYITWIKYESQGAPRLNKISRKILFSYCPFSKALRSKLNANPIYTDYVTKHELVISKKYRTISNYYNKYKNSKGELPQTVVSYINLYTL